MEDTIYRQAAIDAHCELCVDRDKCNCDICPDVEVFQLLPSAQPKIKCIAKITMTDEQVKEAFEKAKCEILAAQPEIIRCKDCARHEYCRTSTAWAVAPDDDWFCADAERITNG